jgi:hypothetical protein
MQSVQCPYCGARSTGQGPTCANCGIPFSTPLTQPRSEQGMYAFMAALPPRRRTSFLRKKGVIIGAVVVIVILIGALAALLPLFGLFSQLENAALPNTHGPGWWKATAPGLGTFELQLNTDQTAITDVVFQIPHITCPGVSYSVTSVQVSIDPPWTVSQGHFDADVIVDSGQDGQGPDIDVDVSGVLPATGQQASGTWIFNGQSACQGSWTGSPSP